MEFGIRTEIIEINESEIDENKLLQAAKIIKEGGLVIFPTETVYGLGADSFNADAIEKIYRAKNRPADNPLIMHVKNKYEIEKYVHTTPNAKKLINHFLPAPLTFVLPKKDIISDTMTRGLPTLAIRVPKNKTAQKLIELSGTPITAPSANLSGKPSPTSARHIIGDMYGRVDMIISGDDSEIGLESTVIAFDTNDRVDILRSGYITGSMISDIIGENNINSANNRKKNDVPISPGMKYRHYAPDAPLYILDGCRDVLIDFLKKEAAQKKVGFLCDDGYLSELSGLNIYMLSLGKHCDIDAQAKKLFDSLIGFNSADVEIIYAIKPTHGGIGDAMLNRLEKAAGGRYIKLD